MKQRLTNLCIARTTARRQRPRQQRLARPRRTVKQHPARRDDPKLLVQLRVQQRERHHLFELVDICLVSPCRSKGTTVAMGQVIERGEKERGGSE